MFRESFADPSFYHTPPGQSAALVDWGCCRSPFEYSWPLPNAAHHRLVTQDSGLPLAAGTKVVPRLLLAPTAPDWLSPADRLKLSRSMCRLMFMRLPPRFEPAEVRFVDRLLQLAELGARRVQDQRHGHRCAGLGGQEGGVERDVVDAAAGQVEPGQPVEVQSRGRRLRRKHLLPDRLALRRTGEREFTMKRSRRMKAGVERALHVGGEDRQAAIGLHALQQVVDLDVGVAVVAVLDLAALAEQRVGLVEEQDRAAVLGGVEQAAQVLLGLADVLADHRRQIDAVEIEPQLVGDAPRPPSSCRCRSRRRTAR